ncbi:hypothetical protein ACPV5U_24455 [Vibrio mediterranei]
MVELFLFATAMGLICAIPKLVGMVASTLISSAGEWLKGLGKVLSFVKNFIVWLILSPVRFASDLSQAIRIWTTSFSKGYVETSSTRKKKARFKNVMNDKKNVRSGKAKGIRPTSNDELLYRSLAEIKTLSEQHHENSEAIEQYRAEKQLELQMMVPTCVRLGIFQTDGSGQMSRDNNGNPVKVTVQQMFNQMESKPAVQHVGVQEKSEATLINRAAEDDLSENVPSYAELSQGECSLTGIKGTELDELAEVHYEMSPEAITADPEDIRQPSGKQPRLASNVPNLAAVI